MTTSPSKPFARYARVSRVGGRSGQGYISVPEQTRTMDALAQSHGVPVLPELFRDEDYSGGNLDRPEFQRILTMLRDGQIGGVIVAKLDRFSRDVVDFLSTLREVEDLGGRLLCGDGNVTLRNGTDAFTATMRVGAAALERSQRREDLAKSVRNAVKDRGVHLQVPFGYRRADGKGTKLVPVEREAKVVKLAFQLRADGATWPAIAKAMNETGVLPRPHKRDGIVRQAGWSHKTARQIVRSEVYLGTAWNGEHRSPGAHDPLVAPKLYARANRAKGTKPLGPGEGYVLTGLVRCSSCGYAMAHTRQGSRRYYRCVAAQHGDGRCTAPVSVPAEPLERYVMDEFETRYLGTSWEASQNDAEVDAAEARVERCETELGNSMAAMRRLGEMTASERRLAEKQLDEDRVALRDAEAELAQARMHARGADLPAHLDSDLFRSSPIAEQRHWISTMFRCVVVRSARVWREDAAGRARIVLADDAPAESTRLIPYVAALDW
jgi:site-specific DNA recombinase